MQAVKIAKAKTSDPRFGTFPGVITLWSDRDNEVGAHSVDVIRFVESLADIQVLTYFIGCQLHGDEEGRRYGESVAKPTIRV